MSKIKVNCEVRSYLDLNERKGVKPLAVEIESHWNDSERVHIKIGNEEAIVIGRQIIAAVENCMKTSAS